MATLRSRGRGRGRFRGSGVAFRGAGRSGLPHDDPCVAVAAVHLLCLFFAGAGGGWELRLNGMRF